MHQVSPELFGKILPEMKKNEIALLTILYQEEGFVPTCKLEKELLLNTRQLGSVFAWFKMRVHREGGSMPFRSDCFPHCEKDGQTYYRLRDHLRPVVGEFLMKKQINEIRRILGS